jgi:hypothetical protein
MKIYKILLLLVAGYSVLLINSCKKDNNDEAVVPSSNQVSPFFTFGKIGNTWVDNIKITGVNDTLSFKLIEKKDSVYKFQVIHFHLFDTAYGYWYISDTEFAFSDDSLGMDKQTILKSDASANSTYYYVNSGDSIIDKVTSTSVNISVPAGTFNCYEVMETQPQQPDTFIYYINKDAGIVKITGNQDNYIYRMLSKNF